jgi:dihydrofolate synthase / folylpolyglutamate synthase
VADHARSDDPAVQAQLDRFAQLSPGRDILGLERITALLDLLGNPHRNLPPVFHVAGTNGKGSTCAFLRAAIEAAGLTAHVYTSPHLCRFNERIRIAGKLIDDDALAPLLREVLDAAEAANIGPSFFEATTAAAFLAFSRTPADAAIIEVGLGGRLDATNVIAAPAVCGIAQLGIDHEAFLGSDAAIIAGEKAGIAKPGTPLVTMAYGTAQAARIGEVAAAAGASWRPKGRDWDAVTYQARLHYKDQTQKLETALPRLTGAHQAMNAALAIAMIRHQSAVTVPDTALKAAIGWASWPARLQKLDQGPVTNLLPMGTQVWLDGGHNPDAGKVLAKHFRDAGVDKIHVVLGMLRNKDAVGFLSPFKDLITSVHAVPIDGHEHYDPADLCRLARDMLNVPFADPVNSVETALAQLAQAKGGVVLICGSLYLAGEVLRANGQLPD